MPTILCVGNFDRQLLVDLQPEQRDAVASLLGPRSMVGPGNLAALNRVSGLLGGYSKPTSVSMADAVSLSDLRAEPAIMIGIFDNAWSPRILANERFQFVESSSGEHYLWLKDTQRPGFADWRIDLSVPLPALQRDWALISRLHSSLTGRTEFVIRQRTCSFTPGIGASSANVCQQFRTSTTGSVNSVADMAPFSPLAIHEFYLEADPSRRSMTSKATDLIGKVVRVAGLNIWGSPVTPLYGGAFGMSASDERAKHYAQIPLDTHVLITHGLLTASLMVHPDE